MTTAELSYLHQPLPPPDGSAAEAGETSVDHAAVASYLGPLIVGDADPMRGGGSTSPEELHVPALDEHFDDLTSAPDGNHSPLVPAGYPDDLDDFLDQPPNPELDHAEACYLAWDGSGGDLNGDPEEFLDRFGVAQADVAAWYAGRPEYEREQMAIHQAQELSAPEREVNIRATLERSAAKLLKGRLSTEQEKQLGDLNYRLGSRQSGYYTVEDARRYLAEYGGAWSNIAQGYIFFDEHTPPTDIDVAVVSGFRGVDAGGKMIVAVPYSGELLTRGTEGSIDTAVHLEDDQLPPDFYVSVKDAAGKESTVVSNKYVAGFVDHSGLWHENAGFGRSSVVEFVSSTQ